MKKITNRILRTELVEWEKVAWLQNPGLKEISKESFERLKNSLRTNSFVMPFNVWDENGKLWFLDGHHREKALKELASEGIKIPDLLPANFIDAKNRKEAVKLILVYSSIYANVTEDGLQEMMDIEGLTFDDLNFEIELPNIDWEKFQKGMGQDIPEKEEKLRPYKMSHVLLSFPPEKLRKIQGHLKKIIKVEGVEYEQGSN